MAKHKLISTKRVVKLNKQGKSLQEISHILKCSVGTVKYHLDKEAKKNE